MLGTDNATSRGVTNPLFEKMQQILHERRILAPIWQLAFIKRVGPQFGESGFGRITSFAYTAPYEDITIKGI